MRTSLPTFARIVLATILLSLGACGQNEGGRCQIDSDCASGLICRGGDTGNGVCESNQIVSRNDAAPNPASDAATDVAPDAAADLAPDTTTSDLLVSPADASADITPDTAAVDSEAVTAVDAETVDVGGID